MSAIDNSSTSNVEIPMEQTSSSAVAPQEPRNNAPTTSCSGKTTGESPSVFGKFGQSSPQKLSATKVSGKKSPARDVATPRATPVSEFRFQVRLENGSFTEALKSELLGGLEALLYQIPKGSFIPEFKGCGLRYGKVWFSPGNQLSSDWLKQKLLEINERAQVKFVIEHFGLHQSNECLNVPPGCRSNERLSDNDILKRI